VGVILVPGSRTSSRFFLDHMSPAAEVFFVNAEQGRGIALRIATELRLQKFGKIDFGEKRLRETGLRLARNRRPGAVERRAWLAGILFRKDELEDPAHPADFFIRRDAFHGQK